MEEKKITLHSYGDLALAHLSQLVGQNEQVLESLKNELVELVLAKKFLFVFGSGHSAILPLELYHRAGGPSFVIPMVADYLLPTAGPPVVRLFERLPQSAQPLLNRLDPQPGEMIWLMSQSGINAAGVDLALEAKKRNLKTVAFTSRAHSSGVPSRHPSGKKLFEVCDWVVDLKGAIGDAALRVSNEVSVGPLSSLSAIFLAHSVLSAVIAECTERGMLCSYTSVNTPEGELKNQTLEAQAKIRDPLLR
ncbi:MAG: sugar isomerase domain-containing protein [Bdellovibrionia bacterium]